MRKGTGPEQGREPAERHSFNRVRGYKWVLISLELEYTAGVQNGVHLNPKFIANAVV